MKMKAFLIARVSDEDQRQALPGQRLRLERYGQEKGFDCELFEFDETAYKDARKEFAAIVSCVSNYPDHSVVVFDKVDRFTRDSTQEEVKTLNKLREAGKIELHFPSDNIYLTKDSPASDLFRLGIGIVLARYYSDAIRDNVKRRFEQKLHDGEWPNKATIGYLNHRTSDKETTVVPDPERAPYVVKAFELRVGGQPFRAIAAQLRAEGFRTLAGRAPGAGYIERMLKNPFYYGVMRYDGKPYPHKYEPLISRKLFNDCQDVNEDRTNHKTKTTADQYVFNGLLRCGHCSCSISSYTAKGHVYMKCSKAKGPCPTKHLKEADLLPQIEAVLGKLELTEDIAEFVIEELRKQHDNQQLYFTTAIEQARSEYDGVQRKLRVLYEDRLDGRITSDEYDGYVTNLKTRQEELDQQLVLLTRNDKSFMLSASYLLEIARKAPELFRSSKPPLRARLLKFLLSNLTLSDEKLVYNLKAPFDAIAECSQTSNWLRVVDNVRTIVSKQASTEEVILTGQY